jgi:hypothetical protein
MFLNAASFIILGSLAGTTWYNNETIIINMGKIRAFPWTEEKKKLVI